MRWDAQVICSPTLGLCFNYSNRYDEQGSGLVRNGMPRLLGPGTSMRRGVCVFMCSMSSPIYCCCVFDTFTYLILFLRKQA